MFESYWHAFSFWDGVICFFGGAILLAQIVFIVCLFLRKNFATQEGEYYRNLLSSLCELLPLMGLLGTVLGILNTFSAMQNLNPGTDAMQEIMRQFAPALTTTVTGIGCLIINLFVNAVYALMLKSEVGDK